MSVADTRSRFRGALVGVAVGDALGAPFEGAPPSGVVEVTERAGSGEWRYTDDTAMTVALAESLLACDGADGAHLADTFRRHWEAEPWRGYGAGPPLIFRQLAQGAAWDEPARGLFGGEGSFGNGAAMRAAPAGLFGYPDVDEAVRVARLQARVTHAHPLGVDGAGVLAAAVALAVGLDAPPGAEAFLEDVAARAQALDTRERLERVAALLPGASGEEVVARIGNGIEALEAVPAAIASALLGGDSFADAVGFAVGLGGDADTIGAMAGAVAGALHGEEGIPEEWREPTEGVDRLREFADALHARL